MEWVYVDSTYDVEWVYVDSTYNVDWSTFTPIFQRRSFSEWLTFEMNICGFHVQSGIWACGIHMQCGIRVCGIHILCGIKETHSYFREFFTFQHTSFLASYMWNPHPLWNVSGMHVDFVLPGFLCFKKVYFRIFSPFSMQLEQVPSY